MATTYDDRANTNLACIMIGQRTADVDRRGVRGRRDARAAMNTTALCTGVLLLGFAGAARAYDPEDIVLARVRLSTEPTVAAGCTRLGSVSDDSVKDLRRKILRVGGNTAILSFRSDDLEMIHADVFRCPPSTKLPAGIPPPPPGTPPPPPPGPAR